MTTHTPVTLRTLEGRQVTKPVTLIPDRKNNPDCCFLAFLFHSSCSSCFLALIPITYQLAWFLIYAILVNEPI